MGLDMQRNGVVAVAAPQCFSSSLKQASRLAHKRLQACGS